MLTEGIGLVSLPFGEQGIDVALLDLACLDDEDSAASRFLAPAEREEYARLRHASRRREWLGARVCVKAMLLQRGQLGDPTQCELVKDVLGRPSLSFAPSHAGSSVYDCSLSHKGRFACAGASSLMGVRVGVDIEEVSPRLLRVASAFAADHDVLIRPRPSEERLALLWAVKEARAKAIGGGLGVALEKVACEETTEGHLRVETGDGRALRARFLRHDEYVIALCIKQDALCAAALEESSNLTIQERTADNAKSPHLR